MSPRKKRLQKLVAHRERELDAQLKKLAEARAREQLARRVADEKQQLFARARAERGALISKPLAAERLALASDWMMACAHVSELAERGVTAAVHAVSEAQNSVLAAKNELKKLELLAERIGREERLSFERGEQKLADEFAALRVAGAEKRRGEP